MVGDPFDLVLAAIRPMQRVSRPWITKGPPVVLPLPERCALDAFPLAIGSSQTLFSSKISWQNRIGSIRQIVQGQNVLQSVKVDSPHLLDLVLVDFFSGLLDLF